MPSSKPTIVLDDNVTLTASTANHTSDVWTIDDGYGGILYIKITNGATGPTLPAQALIQVSPDSSIWYDFRSALVADLGNSIVSTWSIFIAIGYKFLKVISGSNTGQNVTIRIEGTEVASV